MPLFSPAKPRAEESQKEISKLLPGPGALASYMGGTRIKIWAFFRGGQWFDTLPRGGFRLKYKSTFIERRKTGAAAGAGTGKCKFAGSCRIT